MRPLAVQYLDTAPRGATPASVRRRLRQAFERLPITLVLLGWDLPEKLEDAVAAETARHGAQLFRWQPWLTGDARTDLPAEWAVVGHEGAPVAGHAGAADFTFVCPNRSAVADFLIERVEGIASRGIYQGIFLDRIRFPSPAPDPAAHLGCFCRHCARVAAEQGLDLELARACLRALLAEANGARRLARSLLGDLYEPGDPLDAFLDFRECSITGLVGFTARQCRSHGLAIGLDCFSPALARLVGQDLAALDRTCDWIKLMIYPRVFGPAGIPFELLGLADWLTGRYGLPETDVLRLLAAASGLTVPAKRVELAAGLGSGAVSAEIRRGRACGIRGLWAGIALVELAGIHHATAAQLDADLSACQEAKADGLVLSWNLWQIEPETLELVHRGWC